MPPLMHSSPPKGYFCECLIPTLLRITVKQTRYWVEGLHIATYLLNILPKKAISTTSPYFILHGVTSSYEYMCMGTSANVLSLHFST
jgi:hypothetical protein